MDQFLALMGVHDQFNWLKTLNENPYEENAFLSPSLSLNHSTGLASSNARQKELSNKKESEDKGFEGEWR